MAGPTSGSIEGVAAKRPAAVDAGLQFGLRNRWYPIFESRDLTPRTPVGIKRLGEDLALWRDSSGQPHLFIDRCPHRGAAFSEGGTVQGQELQCWYHGFRYDGSGQCTAVPVEGEQTALANRVSITSYPIEERWGMIWAFIGEVDLFPPPPLHLPEEMLAADWSGHIARATWRANWLLVLDNLMDPMHASWLHARSYTLSKGKKSARMEVRDLDDGFVVQRENQRGINFDWTEYHDNGSLWFRLEIPYPRTPAPAAHSASWAGPRRSTPTPRSATFCACATSAAGSADCGTCCTDCSWSATTGGYSNRTGAFSNRSAACPPVCGSTWRRRTLVSCACDAC